MSAKLTHAGYQAARSYLLRAGRTLERELFRYHFEDGELAPLVSALAAHQNPDGGFRDMGEGSRTDSSPSDTILVFRHLRELPLPGDHPLVRDGIRYLLSAYDPHYKAWPQKPGKPRYFEEELDLHWGLPGAEVVACLWQFRELVPPAFLESVTETALARFRQLPAAVPPFAAICYLRLADYLPAPSDRELIHSKISAGVFLTLETDHARWHTAYFIKPHWLAPRPDSPLYPVLKEEIEACLDFEIGKQEGDGAAFLTFAAAGESATTWKSIWTLELLQTSRNFGRLIFHPRLT